MTTHDGGANEAGTGDVSDFTRGVTRRRLLGRGAMGAGLAVAGGALLRPGAADAADGDPVLAAQTVGGLDTETGLAGACTPSVLRLAQSSATGDGLVVQLSDSGASGAGVRSSQAGTGPAIAASTTGSNTAAAITAVGAASIGANTGVVDAINNSSSTNAYAVRATSNGAGGAVLATASTSPAVNAQSTGSGAALFARNTGSGPGVSVQNTNSGAALLLTSSGTSILAATSFAGTPAGIADRAGISITTQSSTGFYVKATSGRAMYAENTGTNDTFYAVNSGHSGNPRAVVAYLANAGATGSAVYGSTAGKGAGVEGKSNLGRGGQFTGRLAQVRLLPGTGAHPASGSVGDLFVDNHGNLWFCKGGASWKQIA
ncbi:MAG TPA: hypothetical protein VGI86_05310 [Acidimicrobiia bacterium]|jgi:hypothetical protein